MVVRGGSADEQTMFTPGNATMTWSFYGQEFKPDTDAAEKIWRIGSPILVVVGLIGNALSAMVMRRKSMRTSVTSLYLIVLAFSDSSVLLTALVYNWLSYGYKTDLQNYSDITCKVHKMIMFFCIHFEAWTLVSVTLERLVAVAFPFRSKTCFTRARARIGLIITACVLLGVNSHYLWDTHVSTTNLANKCTYKEIYGGFCGWYSNTWSYLDLIISSLLPFAAMLVMNSVIIWKLYKSSQFRRCHSEQINVTTPKSSARFDHRTKGVTSQSQSHGGQGAAMSARPMAVLLLTVSFVFILLSLPICVLILLGKKRSCSGNPNSDQELKKLLIQWAVVNIVAYTNNSINFFLYFLSGRRFRTELKKLVCHRKASDSLIMADLADRKLLSNKQSVSVKTVHGALNPGLATPAARGPGLTTLLTRSPGLASRAEVNEADAIDQNKPIIS